jgi:hypothetical protein
MCRFCRDLMQPGLLMSNWPIRSSVAEDIWLQTTWLPIHFVIFLPVPMVATCTYASGLRPTKQRFSMILQRCKPATWGSAIHTHADPWRIPRPGTEGWALDQVSRPGCGLSSKAWTRAASPRARADPEEGDEQDGSRVCVAGWVQKGRRLLSPRAASSGSQNLSDLC